MKPLTLLGQDDAFQPYITDYRKFSNRLVQLFHDQPLVARKLAPMIETIPFDGTTEHETATLLDIDKPEYAFEPHNANTMVEGSSVVVKIPQFFFSAALLEDKWKALFANRDRFPLLVARMLQKIKIEEDRVVFQGDEPCGVQGLVSPLTTDLGGSAGPYADDLDGNGILENLQEDVNAALDYFVALGVGHYPVDIVMTSYIFNVAKNTVIPYQPGVNNLDLIRNKINGGAIYATNNLQANVTAADNTMLFCIRTPESEAPWQIISSGIRQKMKDLGLWKQEFGVRERFTCKILNGELIAYFEDIDAGSTPPEEPKD